MLWLVLFGLVAFLVSYTQLWVDNVSEITEIAIAKYCVNDVKHKVIRGIGAASASSLYATDLLLKRLDEVLISKPQLYLIYIMYKPWLRKQVFMMVTVATYSAIVYTDDICQNGDPLHPHVKYNLLCGSAPISTATISLGYYSPGFLSNNPVRCDWNRLLKVKGDRIKICFDCVNMYAVTYIDKKVLYADRITGKYNVTKQFLIPVVINSKVKSLIKKFSGNMTISYNIS